MANIENRAAEHGSQIIKDDDQDLYTFSTGKTPVAVRILQDTVIAVITSDNCIDIDYYVAKAMTTLDPVILANISSIQLTSGAVQLVYS